MTNVLQLANLAQAIGFPVTVKELQLWAYHPLFDQPFWPWAGKDRAVREAFSWAAMRRAALCD